MPHPGPMGWIPRPAEVQAVCSVLPMPLFEAAAPHLKGTGAGRDVFHWLEGEQAVLGNLLPSFNQTRGTCVSQGWGRAAQDLMLIQTAKGQGSYPAGVATEPIYAGSRVEVGGGRLGNDEGSLGAWAAKWVTDWGILLRQKYGSIDLTRPDDDTAQRWGSSRGGLPDELEPLAKEHPVKTVSLVTSFDAACDAIANLYPVPVCSGQGFSMKRSADGFCRPEGSWAHCMLFRGCGVAKGNRPFLACQNSWADYLGSSGNQVTLESGEAITLPQGCFAVDASTADKMLRARDSFAASNFVGFVAQKPNFRLW